MNNEWLQNLKPGDKVIRRSGGVGAVDYIETITRVTPTQIVIGNARYRKDTGREVGGYDRWHSIWLEEATPEATRKVEATFKRLKLVRELSNMEWGKLPLETLEAVATLLPH